MAKLVNGNTGATFIKETIGPSMIMGGTTPKVHGGLGGLQEFEVGGEKTKVQKCFVKVP